jgi:Tfp pilus assembly protein FimT
MVTLFQEGAVCSSSRLTFLLPSTLHLHVRRAYTLAELVLACVIIGLIAALAVPSTRRLVDAMAVERASREVVNTFALARFASLRYGGAQVRVDSLRLQVQTGTLTLYTRELARTHGVRVRTTQTLVRYAATGLGLGLSNGTIIVSRGASADTVVISRLGRVRR